VTTECKLMKMLALNQQTASLKGLSLHKEFRNESWASHLGSSNAEVKKSHAVRP